MHSVAPLAWLIVACIILFFVIVGTIYFIAFCRLQQAKKASRLAEVNQIFGPIVTIPVQSPAQPVTDNDKDPTPTLSRAPPLAIPPEARTQSLSSQINH